MPDLLPLLDLLDTPAEEALNSGKVREVSITLTGAFGPVTLKRYIATNDPDQERFRTPQGAYRNWHLIDGQVYLK